MIHPSYNELMKVVNNNAEYGEEPVVNSRYSIVIASAKRAFVKFSCNSFARLATTIPSRAIKLLLTILTL